MYDLEWFYGTKVGFYKVTRTNLRFLLVQIVQTSTNLLFFHVSYALFTIDPSQRAVSTFFKKDFYCV